MHIGTAGWSIWREAADSFPGEGQHLQRYARVLNCVEINSSFYRSHRVQVYQRWAAHTPPSFRFSAKVPRSITHEARLRGAREPLESFLAEVAGLGDRLAVLLVQLPPSFAFEADLGAQLLQLAGRAFRGLGGVRAAACELVHAIGRPRAGHTQGVARRGRSGALAASGTAGWLAGSTG